MKEFIIAIAFVGMLAGESSAQPNVENKFRGRIAWSADGNHNDPDDWIASPVALAIFAEAGLKDRLVHFDYNCILPQTNPDWEKKHEESVLGAAERYGFNRALFFDCQKKLDTAIASIVRAIDDSSADNPLYFVIAGPMEVPSRGIEKSDPAKRRFVYCISHSRWNDGFASNYKFTFTKRSVIDQDVNWVQIRDQNRLLSLSPYGRPAKPEDFAAFYWMRDAREARVRFLWERMLVSTRPDPSDAGMAYFVASGDEDCDPVKLKRLLDEHQIPSPMPARTQVRVEAENFRYLEGFAIEDRKDKAASHQLDVAATGKTGRIRTRLCQPFMADAASYDVEIRYRDDPAQGCRYTLFVNGVPRESTWSSAPGNGWKTQAIPGVELRIGDEIRVDAEGPSARFDYVQLNLLKTGAKP